MMPTLIANYGYDVHHLELTADEVEVLRSKRNFHKLGEVWSESAGGMVEGTWCFDFEKGEHWVHCDDGLSFSIHEFHIE